MIRFETNLMIWLSSLIRFVYWGYNYKIDKNKNLIAEIFIVVVIIAHAVQWYIEAFDYHLGILQDIVSKTRFFDFVFWVHYKIRLQLTVPVKPQFGRRTVRRLYSSSVS